MKTYDSKLDKIVEMTKNMIVQNQYSNSFPDKMDSPKYQDSTAEVLDNNY